VDRQPLIALIALSACAQVSEYRGAWNEPGAVTLMPATPDSIFDVPVGVVAQRRDGVVQLLDLANGRYLSASPAASFVRANPIPTGRQRVLSGAVGMEYDGKIDIWTTDLRFNQLVKAPFISGVNEQGHPQTPLVTLSDVTSTGSGKAKLSQVAAWNGYAATEDWTLTRGEVDWQLQGSLSGVYNIPVIPGLWYRPQDGAVSFLLENDGEPGDQFTFSTDSGVEAFDLGGAPLNINRSPGGEFFVVSVQNDLGGELQIWDPVTSSMVTQVSLAADSIPGRMEWSADSQTVLVADVGRSAYWEISTDGTAVEHVMPFPVFDVVPLYDGNDKRAVVIPITQQSVWLYDQATATFRDYNPLTSAPDGMSFPSLITGVSASPEAYELPEYDNDGQQPVSKTVGISLSNGEIVWLRWDTGCLVSEFEGPRTVPYDGGKYYDTNFTQTATSPGLTTVGDMSGNVVINECLGIAHEDIWTLRYSEIYQAWEVQARYGGYQGRMAYEDQRYISDRGEVSFLIRAGGLPSLPGYQMEFTVDPGYLSSNGTFSQAQSSVIPIELPSDPLLLTIDNPVFEDGPHPVTIVSSQASERVMRIWNYSGEVEVVWD